MPPLPATATAAPPARASILGGAALLVLAALAAYHNTFSVPFLFDDIPSITDNPSIRHLWPLWDVLAPTGGYGITVSGRPVLNLSLALSYALSGFDPWGYHAVNLLIHALAGLALFGIVRRTLQRPTPCGSLLAGDSSRASSLLQPNALPVAFTVALLWTLHPLQPEAVTYVIQRTESLMGLFFLLTFYGFIRAVEAPRPWRWQVLTVLACLLGMGTKEVAATAPLLVLLYDRTFVAGTFRAAWRCRRWLHLSLAATWVPLALLVSGTGWNRGGTAGFNVGLAPWAYWFTQFEAVARYLQLAVWPHPLVFEYGTFWMGLGDAAPYALVVVPLVAATLVALWRRPVAGFLGAWFFTILAPTSVVPGTIQMIVEHRMYLPLAAVIALGVGAAVARLGRPALAPFLALALGAGVLAGQRNAVYRSDLTLWQDTVANSPGSAIAQSSLGTAWYLRGHLREAMHHYQVSLRLNSNLPIIHHNLGLTYAAMGHLPEAAAHYAESFRLNPRFYPAHYQLGLTLLQSGRPQEALTHFAQVVQLMPTMPEAQYEWGVALFRLGRPADAIPHYREALRLNPDYVEAECDLGVALYNLDQAPAAAECFERALRRNPDRADTHFNLALARERMGRTDQAIEQYAATVRLDPQHVGAQLNLGVALAQAGKLPEALAHLEEAARLEPDNPDAHCNLGIVLAEAGRLDEAVSHYEDALRLRSDYAEAHYNLGNALIKLRRLPEARLHFEAAVRIKPDFAAARDMLNRLQSLPLLP